MSVGELDKLPDEELRIRCAELCGWKPYGSRGFRDGSGREWIWDNPALWVRFTLSTDLPDFPNDLNAMHVAERMMFDDYASASWPKYLKCLHLLCFRGGSGVHQDHVHATSRQRCIAFIATKQAERQSADESTRGQGG